MKTLGRIALGLSLLLALAAVWLVRAWNDRPSLAPLEAYALPPAAPGAQGVRVTFLGVATLLFEDGETALMTDGFFSRPSALALATFRPIEPDRERISAALAGAGVDTLAAVLVVHSHYDHSMDAPEVARRTGAVVLGSRSTANVARGWGLPEAQIREVVPGEAMRFGAFRVTFVASKHVPLPPPAAETIGREIEEPLVPPAPSLAYLEGGSYSILIEHPRGNALVQGSAGWIEGALAPYTADVVLLGVGGLGRQGPAYTQAYWREVVEAVGARLVLPIHWDDFTRPLGPDLVPFPRILEDFGETASLLLERADADPDVQFGMLPPLVPVLLY